MNCSVPFFVVARNAETQTENASIFARRRQSLLTYRNNEARLSASPRSPIGIRFVSTAIAARFSMSSSRVAEAA